MKSCSKSIDKCDLCFKKDENYENDIDGDVISNLLCLQCKDNYVIIDDDSSICYSNESFKENKKYYYIDSFHMKSCSKSIDKCDECIKKEGNEGDIMKCEKCFNDYYLVTHEISENITCKEIDEIKPFDEYYYIEEKKLYNYCGNKHYHSMSNCKKCNSSTSCNLCKDGFTFISNEKSTCENISKLGKKYIMDEFDNTIYRKCDYYMENCDTCSSKDSCLTCGSNYNLFFNKKICINISDNHYYKNFTDNMSYFCNQSINRCDICSNSHTCRRCVKDYYLVGTSLNECLLLSEFDVVRYYLNSSNDNQYLKCSNAISNCFSCDSHEKCNLCESGFVFLDNNFKKCYNKLTLNMSKYFTEDYVTYKSCENEKFRSSLQCFSIIKNQNIILSFIQVQLIGNHLYCYMLTDSPFPKDFSLKTKIVINNTPKRLRHLDQLEKEIVLRASDDSNGDGKTIIRFISDEKFDTNENIQLKEIVPNDDNLTKSVTENNTFSIEDFNSELKESNTKEVKLLIDENKITDFSKIEKSENGEMNKINFNLDSFAGGCDLNFKSEKSASFSQRQLPIEIVDSNGNIVNAKCDLGNDIKTIKCIISDEIENKYTLKDAIVYSSSNYVIISANGEILKISCKKKESKFKNSNITFIVVTAIVVLILLIVSIIGIKYNSQPENENTSNKTGKNPNKTGGTLRSETDRGLK